MTRPHPHLLALALAVGLAAIATAPGAQEPCYASYKAKRDDPLRLHFGVAELRGACTESAAQGELAPRLDRAGWTLLTIVDLFGEEGLGERRESAGEFFLRF